LNGSLESASKEETAEARLILEQLDIRLGRILLLVGKGFLDLLELGLDPDIVLIAMSMELCQILETLLTIALGDEPAGRL
jgi:hypothetical protein